MKNKTMWIILAAAVLVLAVLILVIVNRNPAAPAAGEAQSAETAQSAENATAAEAPAQSETTGEAQAPAGIEPSEETGEEEDSSVLIIPDGMEVGGEGLD